MAEARRREVLSWSLYDFGSSAFNTLMLTFIYGVFFAKVLAPDFNTGTVMWTRALNITAVIVAIISPIMGAVADYSGRKKLFLTTFAALSLVFTTLLFFVKPGAAGTALLLFVIANIGFETANVFYYAFLPDVSTEHNMGRVSGLGFALGYIGGLLALVIALGMFQWITEAEHLNVRATILLVAAWWLVFSVPMLLFVKQKNLAGARPHQGYLRHGFERLLETARHARHYREAGKLLLARMIYNDGLTTIIGMASIYAYAVLHIPEAQFLKLGILLNVCAGIGAFSFGFVDDRIGGKKTILISLVFLIAAAVIGVMTTTAGGFTVAAALIGLMLGPNQSASRSLLSKLVPNEKQAEFFGLYSFSGKMSSMLGPLAYGGIVASTGNHKAAMASIIVFFVVGGLILLTVSEREGMRLAGREVT
ncbi:MAG TPA: MFS transporter [Longimicrobiales bacterium]